jgi:hypothetical protein
MMILGFRGHNGVRWLGAFGICVLCAAACGRAQEKWPQPDNPTFGIESGKFTGTLETQYAVASHPHLLLVPVRVLKIPIAQTRLQEPFVRSRTPPRGDGKFIYPVLTSARRMIMLPTMPDGQRITVQGTIQPWSEILASQETQHGNGEKIVSDVFLSRLDANGQELPLTWDRELMLSVRRSYKRTGSEFHAVAVGSTPSLEFSYKESRFPDGPALWDVEQVYSGELVSVPVRTGPGVTPESVEALALKIPRRQAPQHESAREPFADDEFVYPLILDHRNFIIPATRQALGETVTLKGNLMNSPLAWLPVNRDGKSARSNCRRRGAGDSPVNWKQQELVLITPIKARRTDPSKPEVEYVIDWKSLAPGTRNPIAQPATQPGR